MMLNWLRRDFNDKRSFIKQNLFGKVQEEENINRDDWTTINAQFVSCVGCCIPRNQWDTDVCRIESRKQEAGGTLTELDKKKCWLIESNYQTILDVCCTMSSDTLRSTLLAKKLLISNISNRGMLGNQGVIFQRIPQSASQLSISLGTLDAEIADPSHWPPSTSSMLFCGEFPLG